MRSSLIILTFNEIEGIRALFDKIPFAQFDECFVIDGNSTDGTAEFFKENKIKVITQQKKGRGAAFREAAETASGQVLVFFSPDGNENPADVIKLKETVEKGYDMVIASRFMPGASSEDLGAFIPYRDWANKIFTYLANLFFGGGLTDSINGFRAIKKDKFRELKVNAEGFSVEYQMSIRAMKLGHKIKEIPTVESPRIGGQSTAKTIPTGFKILKILFKEILIGKNF